MKMKAVLFLCLVHSVYAPLPPLPDCEPAQSHPFSSFDPASLFGSSQEIGLKATPQRVGSLRQKGPLPTGHFATGHIKNKQIWPMILTPYQALLTPDGAVYDSYTMDRWSDPERSDFMEQQSAWEAGKPWNKLHDMGSNMRQMTSGPDGNPRSPFTGKSGVRVAIPGAGEPEMTSFGELYANFRYSGNGGTMEMPLVRGASMLSHVIKSANPVVKPFCLSSINGKHISLDCPLEPSAGDGGGGHLESECHGGVLTITLHNSKIIRDLSKLQWSAETKGNWGKRYMRTCDTAHCSLQDGGKTVKIRVSQASGTMAFAVNYIGHYLLPPDWGNHPEEVTCGNKRHVPDHVMSRRGVGDITMTGTCSTSQNMRIVVDMGKDAFPGLNKFQYALESQSTWVSGWVPPMRTCDASHCHRQGNTVVISAKAPAQDYKLAVNVIGLTTFPRTYWLDRPYTGRCDGSSVGDGSSSSSSGQTHTTSSGGGAQTSAPHTVATTHQTFTAMPTGDFSQPNKKFILELNEPGSDLPDQTRKFILYFSSPVVARLTSSSDELQFEPQGGGKFTGLLQLAYAGSSKRGDRQWVNFFDAYAGVYANYPAVKYCVSGSAGKSYVSFDWNPADVSGDTTRDGKLLMVAMPHHALLLEEQSHGSLVNTPFTFKGKEGSDWLMAYDVLHTQVAPDAGGVNSVKANSGQLKDMLAAIDRDAKHDYLDSYCAHTDSYNGGKALGMSTRLASISRAFGTDHHHKTDTSIKNCLEKWLRVQDSLDNMWKFHYDTVWGGLYLRATSSQTVDWGVDYGFPYYNDHHFHLGYYLYALAYIAKHYPDWAKVHKERIYSLARDVANPSSSDRHFPVSRQKDIYTGFSWASGLVPGTRQEESASEGINCYHGLAALGEAYGDRNMEQTGQVLLAMEVHSVREYWQVRKHNRAHFPPAIQKTGVVGMVTEPDFFAYTLNWPCDPNIFPQRHACLVGIQVIPVTAVSKYWVDQEWSSSIKESCETAINPPSAADYSKAEKTQDLLKPLNSGWQAFCYMAMSPMDSSHKTRAANYVKGKTPQQLVGGTGAASSLLFIYAST